MREYEMPDILDQEIKHATFIRATPERVFDTLTTVEGWNSWFTAGTKMDPRPGGEILFKWVDFGADRRTFEERRQVLEAKRPERFVFQWRPDSPEYPTTVENEFEPRENGTVIRLREYGYQNTQNGWKAPAAGARR